MRAQNNLYDEIEYPSKPFLQCHPDRLALIGRLWGLDTADPEQCRVLELGCGDGLNLIAAAVSLPAATFHGVDLSAAAIARGRNVVRELKLRNVHLHQKDLCEMTLSRRKFDYIVAHGLYSWVSRKVRECLLDAVRRHLAPNGVAFVSYNAYPGAYLRQMVREMALRSSGGERSPALSWLQSAFETSEAPPVFRAALADEIADMLRRDEGALFHDDFAAINQPFYFADFMQHASSRGLQFVAEAGEICPELPRDVQNRLESEQRDDFRRGRRFRQTLLCHASKTVAPAASAKVLANCSVGGPISPGMPSLEGNYEYRNRFGASCMTSRVEDRLILDLVGAAWPRYIPVRYLSPELEPLLHLCRSRMLDIRLVAPPVANCVSGYPEASPLARLQASRNLPITSLHHVEVAVTSSSLRAILPLVDGTRTIRGLKRDVRLLFPEETAETVAAAVDIHLQDLLDYGLLVDGSMIKGRNNSRSKLNVTLKASGGRARKGR